MKRLITIVLLLAISYGIIVFVTLEWNIILWDAYLRAVLLIILWFLILINTIIDTSETKKKNKHQSLDCDSSYTREKK